MKKTIPIPVSEIKEVFELLEQMNDLFHQPLNYQNSELMNKFAEDKYPEIRKLYYETVWKWLPEEEKKHYESR